MSLTPAITRRGAENPAAAAILAPSRPALSHGALSTLISSTAESLRGLGVRPREDRWRARGRSQAATKASSAFAGGRPSPLNTGLRPSEIEFALGDFGARTLIIAPPVTEPIEELAKRMGVAIVELVVEAAEPAGTFALSPRSASTAPSVVTDTDEPAPGDVALILHTWGTTARPKIVPLTHGALAASAANVIDALALDRGDRSLTVMPLFHIHGIVASMLSTLASGGTVVCPDGFNALEFWRWVETYRPTWYSAVPTMHQLLLARADRNLDVIRAHPFRFIRSSSAPLPPVVLERLEATFNAPVLEAYGMTEASHQMTSNPLPPLERRRGSVGRADGIEIAILDEAGRHRPVDVTGEVAIRGATVFAGYERNPQANEAAFSNVFLRRRAGRGRRAVRLRQDSSRSSSTAAARRWRRWRLKRSSSRIPTSSELSPSLSRTRGSVRRWAWPSCRVTVPRSPSRRSRRSRQSSLGQLQGSAPRRHRGGHPARPDRQASAHRPRRTAGRRGDRAGTQGGTGGGCPTDRARA